MPGTPIMNSLAIPVRARDLPGPSGAADASASTPAAPPPPMLQSTPVRDERTPAEVDKAAMQALFGWASLVAAAQCINKGRFAEPEKTYDSITRFLGKTPYEQAVREVIAQTWLKSFTGPSFIGAPASFIATLESDAAPGQWVRDAHRKRAARELGACETFALKYEAFCAALPKPDPSTGFLSGLRSFLSPVGVGAFKSATWKLSSDDKALRCVFARKWLEAAEATGKLSATERGKLEAIANDPKLSSRDLGRVTSLIDTYKNTTYFQRIINVA